MKSPTTSILSGRSRRENIFKNFKQLIAKFLKPIKSGLLLLFFSTIFFPFFLSTLASFHIIEANNGLEGWRILKSGANVDLILTDLDMPAMNGYELIKLVRNHEKAAISRLPIVMLTSGGQTEPSRDHAIHLRHTTCFSQEFFRKRRNYFYNLLGWFYFNHRNYKERELGKIVLCTCGKRYRRWNMG